MIKVIVWDVVLKLKFLFLIKIDSIYRNELMDDILNLLKLVRNSRIILEENFKKTNKKDCVIKNW